MLYKFKSKVTGDVIMLQAHGERLLAIIGKHSAQSPSVRGILLPQDMPAALQALQAAIAQEQAQQQEALARAQAEGLPKPRLAEVSLRQRALPLMDMMRTCLAEDEPIVWGV
ncbi:MAG: hypothetical protein OHK0048_03110 [Rhodoferax sp.]